MPRDFIILASTLESMRTVVVTNLEFHDWVLGGIARDIAEQGDFRLVSIDFSTLKSLLNSSLKLFFAKELIFVNQDTFFRVSRFLGWAMVGKVSKVLYTHTDPTLDTNWKLLRRLNIVCINTSERDMLVEHGVKAERIVVCPTGVDFDYFTVPAVKPKSNRVLLVSNFKERKNPALLLQVVLDNPDFEFTLIGRGWENSEIFSEIEVSPNFSYLEFSSPNYLKCLELNHIFLSLSTLEGGPLPMLETMACNLIPVCLATGWVNDLIVHGENGFILSRNSQGTDVRYFLLQAKSLELNTRDTIREFTYERYLNNFTK